MGRVTFCKVFGTPVKGLGTRRYTWRARIVQIQTVGVGDGFIISFRSVLVSEYHSQRRCLDVGRGLWESGETWGINGLQRGGGWGLRFIASEM